MVNDRFLNNFKNAYEGKNEGLDTGLTSLNKYISGLQKSRIITVGASPKVGKTTFVDYCFLLSPYINNIVNTEKKKNIQWIYFSYEIDKVNKIYKLLPYFIFKDYGIKSIKHNGEEINIDANLLSGRKYDRNGNLIKINEDLKEIVIKTYNTRIKELFKYMTIFESRENPTGIRNFLINLARENGEIIYDTYTTIEDGQKIIKNKFAGYKPNDPDKFTIVIIDHIRKLKSEKSYNVKETIDKMLEYEVELRNLFGFTFINIAHINREIDNIDLLKFAKDKIYPTSSHFKDSGNPVEESDVVITLFNPRDEKYMLSTHFGYNLKELPGYRSIHIIENRYGEKSHIFTQMNAELNTFKEI